MSEKEVVSEDEGGLGQNIDLSDESLLEDGLHGARASFGAEELAGLYDDIAQVSDALLGAERPVVEMAAQSYAASGHFFTDHTMLFGDVGSQETIGGGKSNFQHFVGINEAELSVMMLGEAREEELADEEDNNFNDGNVIGSAIQGVYAAVAGYQAVVVIEERHDPAPEVSSNIAPVAQDDAFVGNEGFVITGNVLDDNGSGVDTDADGGTLSVVAGTYATDHGSIIIAADGAFSYTPDVGYSGADSYFYTLEDGQGGSDTGAINLTLNAVADIVGNDVANTLTGDQSGVSNDTIYGNGGNDTLVGGYGADVLNGGTGSDTFKFTVVEDGIYDTVEDFTRNGTQTDVLDLRDILGGYDPVSDAIADFVQITDNGTDSFVSVDVDGGADNFVMVACLLDIVGLTNAMLLVPEAPAGPGGGGPGPAQPF